MGRFEGGVKVREEVVGGWGRDGVDDNPVDDDPVDDDPVDDPAVDDPVVPCAVPSFVIPLPPNLMAVSSMSTAVARLFEEVEPRGKGEDDGGRGGDDDEEEEKVHDNGDDNRGDDI